MKHTRLLLLIFILLMGFSCSEDDDAPEDVIDDGASKAVIGGKDFTPADTKVVATLDGLEIKLKKDTEQITLRLEDDVNGTYALRNSAPGGRTKAMVATAEYIDASGKVHYGESGTITLTINADNSVTVTFSFTATSAGGAKVNVANGTVTKAMPGVMANTGCLLTKISDSEQPERMVFKYDGDGKLTYLMFDDSGDITYVDEYFFTYVADKVTAIRVIYHHDDETEHYDYSVTYGNDLITSIEGLDGEEEYTFGYTSGRVTLLGDRYGDETDLYQIEYDGSGNITTFASDDYEETHELFDAKNNPGALLAKSVGNQPALLYMIGFVDSPFSKNNPGKITNVYDGTYSETKEYTYQYNTSNYPTKMTKNVDDEFVDQETYTYSKCN